MKVLVVDDEKLIVKGIKFSLEADDYEVECAYDGSEALNMLRDNEYDVVLLDVMLPVYNGFEVCARVREYSNVPIIMLTAKSDDKDIILGLDCGADDYVSKPFNIEEVKARIVAIKRRIEMSEKSADAKRKSKEILIGDMRIDVDNKSLFIGNREIRVTVKEFELIELLASNPGRVYSREKLRELIWDSYNAADLRTVDVHVRRLREKIEDNPSEPHYVMTKWGVGYYFNA